MRLLVFLLSVLVLCSVPSQASYPPPVRDINGHDVEGGVEYYIRPALDIHAPGLAQFYTKTCPLRVGWENHETPVIFTPVTGKDVTVRLSTDLNVRFAANGTSCSESSTVWTRGNVDEVTKYRHIVTGGVEGNPGTDTVPNWFRIKYDGTYFRIVFCPTVCKCNVKCGEVGLIRHNGRKFLVIKGEPFPVVFVRASTSHG